MFGMKLKELRRKNDEDKINKLKLTLKEAEMLNNGKDMTIEDLEKALQIVDMIKRVYNIDTK